MADGKQRLNTSTQVRNLYSDKVSYMNIKFFNMNLSFQFFPFQSLDQNGRSVYDQQKGLITTVNWVNAFALYKVAKDIIENKCDISQLVIPCADATLTLERKANPAGVMETILTLTKNGTSIPFVFPTQVVTVRENGNMVQKVIESGLGAFEKTIDGYLTGINADRHLDKMTEDYVKSLGENANGNQQPQQGFQTGSGYNNNYKPNNYKKWNNNGGNRKPYNNNQNYNQGSPQSWQPPNQQNMSTYQPQ